MIRATVGGYWKGYEKGYDYEAYLSGPGSAYKGCH